MSNFNIKNRIGEKFTRLMVVSLSSGRTSSGGVKWLCKCDCGKEIVVEANSLVSGNTRSCGCLFNESNKLKSEQSLRRKFKSEYDAWQNMIQRCTNPNHEDYCNYGGRGVMVCDRWIHFFENFIYDMGRRPAKGYSLDRYPNNDTGNYEPSNCRWGTKPEQERNKRTNHWVEYNGERMVLMDWAIRLNKPYTTLRHHIQKGRSIGEIISRLRYQK